MRAAFRVVVEPQFTQTQVLANQRWRHQHRDEIVADFIQECREAIAEYGLGLEDDDDMDLCDWPPSEAYDHSAYERFMAEIRATRALMRQAALDVEHNELGLDRSLFH